MNSLFRLVNPLTRYAGSLSIINLTQRNMSLMTIKPAVYHSIFASSMSIKPMQPELMQIVRNMNRNARRPTKANHGKRPCSNCRRRAKIGAIQSRSHKKKIFGFW